MCDSFLGEGKVGVADFCYEDKIAHGQNNPLQFKTKATRT